MSTEQVMGRPEGRAINLRNRNVRTILAVICLLLALLSYLTVKSVNPNVALVMTFIFAACWFGSDPQQR